MVRPVLLKMFALLLCVAPALAFAQGPPATYPDRPIKWIVPFSAGSFSDILCRTLAPEMSAQLGQPIVIENLPGGGATIGTARAKSAPPDGYTILYAGSSAFATNVSLMNLTYNPVKDFAGVTMLGHVNYVLAAPTNAPFNTFAELLAYAKSHPDHLNYASPGNGTSSHLTMELLKASTGMQLRHIPYKGSTPGVMDLVAGRVQLMLDPYASLGSHLQARGLKAFAVTGTQRMEELPDVPTFAELGLTGFDVSLGWFGLVVPAGTPKEIVAKLNTATTAALRKLAPKLAELGVIAAPGTPEAFMSFVAAEIPRYSKLIADTGTKVD